MFFCHVQMSILPKKLHNFCNWGGRPAANPLPPNLYNYGDEYIWKTLLQFYMTTDSNKSLEGNYIGTHRELIYN